MLSLFEITLIASIVNRSCAIVFGPPPVELIKQEAYRSSSCVESLNRIRKILCAFGSISTLRIFADPEPRFNEILSAVISSCQEKKRKTIYFPFIITYWYNLLILFCERLKNKF